MRMRSTSKTGAPRHNRVFENMGHECSMLAEEDLLHQYYPGESLCAKLCRAWTRLLLVNEAICKRSSNATMHIRSHGSVKKEKERQLAKYQSTIHPFSRLKIGWDFFTVFIYLFQVISVSLDLAYFSFPFTAPVFSSTAFLITRFVGDLICCVDVIFKSCTGFYDEAKKEIILDHKKIFVHYLKTSFLVDFTTSVPTHYDLFINLKSTSEGLLVLDILQGVALLKVFKIIRMLWTIKTLSNMCSVDYFVRQTILIILCVICFWFCLSCLLIYGYHICNDTKNMHAYRNTTFFRAFSRSLYDGALIMHTSSYGVVAPENNSEYLMTNVLWVVSKFIQIMILARYMELLKARTSPHMKYAQIVKQIVEFMRYKQLPLTTQRRILTYYEYHYQKCYFRESEIYGTISGQLRQEIMMEACRQLVENVDFFSDLPVSLLVRIVNCLKSEIYLTNDLIVKANTIGNCMYFISTGTVAVYTISGKEVCHLEDGSHFGEVALVMEDSKRIASVIAVETCQLFRLDRNDFVRAINPYPDLLEKIEKIALQRAEKTTMMNEHHHKVKETNKKHLPSF